MGNLSKEQMRLEIERLIVAYISTLKREMVGKTIVGVIPDQLEIHDGSFILVFENNSALKVIAEGDDMAHVVYEVQILVTCPKCGESVPILRRDYTLYNQMKNSGKSEMLYWRYNHRFCRRAPSDPLQAKERE